MHMTIAEICISKLLPQIYEEWQKLNNSPMKKGRPFSSLFGPPQSKS